MSKTFRNWDVDQDWLLPQSLHEFVPADHVAHFIRDLVKDELDISAIMDSYDDERGCPPYHPGMMVAVLLYGYTQGVYSSRRIARCCEERLDFMAVTAMNTPDFRTISDFRKRHLSALADLFLQVLLLCRTAGLVQLGHLAIDGTKLKANASRHRAMSYLRMRHDPLTGNIVVRRRSRVVRRLCGQVRPIGTNLSAAQTGCMAMPEGTLIMELHFTGPSAPDESQYKQNETLGRE